MRPPQVQTAAFVQTVVDATRPPSHHSTSAQFNDLTIPQVNHSTLQRLASPFLLPILLLTLTISHTHSQEQISKEYQIKAVLLFRLSQFVQWPTNRFATPESPVVIGVLGRSPFGNTLRVAVRNETAHNRPIEIRQLRREDDPRQCHLLFICNSEEPRLREILAPLSGQSILTVSDIEGFASTHGGIVRFITSEGKVNMRINIDVAKQAGLVFDSRLLRLAEVVKKE